MSALRKGNQDIVTLYCEDDCMLAEIAEKERSSVLFYSNQVA